MICGICGFKKYNIIELLDLAYCHCEDEGELSMDNVLKEYELELRSMKEYVITLKSVKIGTTKFEKSDALMGVVCGLVKFDAIENPYKFFHDYCKHNNVIVNQDEPEHEFISTQSIPYLSAFNEQGVEVQGFGVIMSGSNEYGYYIEVFGIAYPFYGEEFPHHVEVYESMFK